MFTRPKLGVSHCLKSSARAKNLACRAALLARVNGFLVYFSIANFIRFLMVPLTA